MAGTVESSMTAIEEPSELPARRKRTQQLRSIAAVVSAGLDSAHHGTQQETTELDSRLGRT